MARRGGSGCGYVIVPQMKVVIEFYVVVSVITILSSVFAYVYMIGGGRGGPGTSTMVVELYIFNALIRTSLPGIASAVSVMLFLVSLLLIVPLFSVRRRANEEALRRDMEASASAGAGRCNTPSFWRRPWSPWRRPSSCC